MWAAEPNAIQSMAPGPMNTASSRTSRPVGTMQSNHAIAPAPKTNTPMKRGRVVPASVSAGVESLRVGIIRLAPAALIQAMAAAMRRLSGEIAIRAGANPHSDRSAAGQTIPAAGVQR